MNLGKEIHNIKIEDIIPNRFQPRLTFDENELNELVNSIKQHGIIQPLVLRKVGDKYEIIAGERRYKAATKAGITEVPAIITVLDDKESAEIAVVENIQRKALSAIEEARSYRRLLDLGQLTQEQLALRMGKSQANVANKLRLLNLSEEVQNALLTNKISERHARSLLQLKDNEKQKEILNKIILERLTVKQTDDIIKDILNSNNNVVLNTDNVQNITTDGNNSDIDIKPIDDKQKFVDEVHFDIDEITRRIENLDLDKYINVGKEIEKFDNNTQNNEIKPVFNDVIGLNQLNNDNNVSEFNQNMNNVLNGLDIVDTKSDVFNDTEQVIEDKTQILDINKIKEAAQDINKPKDLPNFDDLLKNDNINIINNENKPVENSLFNLDGNRFVPILDGNINNSTIDSSENNEKIVDISPEIIDKEENLIKPINISNIELPKFDEFSLPKLNEENSNMKKSIIGSIVNKLRDTINTFPQDSSKININELDLPNEYQIIITINK